MHEQAQELNQTAKWRRLECALHLFAKEVQVWHSQTGAAFAKEDLSYPRVDRLPGHARGQHGQRVA